MSRPNSAAIDGLVRSSLVGPSPPVVITAPVRSSASRTAAAIASAVVAHGRRRDDLHADRRELAREVRGVGVDREAEQQLVADRDDFDVHGAMEWRAAPARLSSGRERARR